jgi:hypothetical protein
MMRNNGKLTEIAINSFQGTKSEISSKREGVSLLSLWNLQTAL